MSKTPPPLLGFNNNVKHQGRVFHIQTEDSGVKHPRVVTHLFADDGRILKSSRADYSEHVGREDMVPVVKRIMKEQHKAMFIALRAGDFDDLIERASSTSLPPVSARTSEPVPVSSKRTKSDRPRARRSSKPPRKGATEPAGGTRAAPKPPEETGSASGQPRRRPPPLPARAKSLHSAPVPRPSGPPQSESAPGKYAPSRPAAIFAEGAPAKQSIFGESVISEKSLDEVILSYLAEDLEGSPQE